MLGIFHASGMLLPHHCSGILSSSLKCIPDTIRISTVNEFSSKHIILNFIFRTLTHAENKLISHSSILYAYATPHTGTKQPENTTRTEQEQKKNAYTKRKLVTSYLFSPRPRRSRCHLPTGPASGLPRSCCLLAYRACLLPYSLGAEQWPVHNFLLLSAEPPFFFFLAPGSSSTLKPRHVGPRFAAAASSRLSVSLSLPLSVSLVC